MTDLKDMLSSLYSFASDAKNFLYDSGLADSVRIPVPVLSIGNLSFGGTGKTPVTEKILSLCEEKGLKSAVVARNYKAQSTSVQKVDLHHSHGAIYYGDEAYLLAQKFPEFPVWTGPKKFLTAQSAFQQALSPLKLIVVDDGFQHRSLHRDFDLVLIDCTSQEDEDELLPKGRFREGFSSLQRASAVALTKVNWADPSRVEHLRKKIPAGKEIYEIEFHQHFSNQIEPTTPVLAVSGIAKPKTFEKNLVGYSVREHLVFPDHHFYSSDDLDKIMKAFKIRDCQQILTTEKDFVKLQNFPEIRDLLNPILVTTEFRGEPRGLNAFLDNCRQL